MKFDETMEMVLEHCKRILYVPYVGPQELERLIHKSILHPDAKPSPVLKYFNHIQGTSNFDITKKVLIELEQKVFKEYIGRLNKAHQY